MRLKDALHDVASNWSTLKKEAPELALKGPISEATVRKAYDLICTPANSAPDAGGAAILVAHLQ
jgi:hypothetical protein